MYNIKIPNKLTSITTWKVLGLSLATRGISWKGEIGPQSSSRNTLKIINEKGGWEQKYHKMYDNIIFEKIADNLNVTKFVTISLAFTSLSFIHL